jgi:hypothetical protein
MTAFDAVGLSRFRSRVPIAFSIPGLQPSVRHHALVGASHTSPPLENAEPQLGASLKPPPTSLISKPKNPPAWPAAREKTLAELGLSAPRGLVCVALLGQMERSRFDHVSMPLTGASRLFGSVRRSVFAHAAEFLLYHARQYMFQIRVAKTLDDVETETESQ